MLSRRHILLGVTGGIAAYKAVELVRLLLKEGATVQTAMTPAATRFVGALTFEALTGRRPALDLFGGEEAGKGHLDIVRGIDLMVIAPATANSIARLAHGLADDPVSTAALALTAPLLICPAMNPRMYQHPAVQANLKTLADRGVHIMEPGEGAMAHPLEEPGVGRLPEPPEILDRICRLLPPGGELSGQRVIVTAGPTREALDPVRFLSNGSSGAMGFALAAEARRRGAQTILISGPTDLPPPPGLDVQTIISTEDLRLALEDRFPECDILIMAAAPADFRPRRAENRKIKKREMGDQLALPLEATPDLLKGLANRKGDRLLIGFALETENGADHARRKLREKNLDLIVLNHPHPATDAGMGADSIQATLIGADGSQEVLPLQAKSRAAAVILDRIIELRRIQSAASRRDSA